MIIINRKQYVIYICCIISLIYGLIVYRFYWLQIKHCVFFREKAQKQNMITLLQLPERGIIVDRNNIPLATNCTIMSAFIIPKQLTPTQSQELQELFPSIIIHYNKNFQYIARSISSNEQKKLEKKSYIHFLQEKGRYYHHKSCAPLIGTTNIDNQGISGIEYSLDTMLKGNPTEYCIQKDGRNRSWYYKEKIITSGIDAQSVTLTIDSTLQFLTYEIMEKNLLQWGCKEAAALVMDPKNGEILALIALASHEQNKEQYSHLFPISHMYEFGSVNKAFVALAALEEGIVTIDTPIDCKNLTTAFINGRKINTWKAHGTIPFWQVIAESNNIGIAQVALTLEEKLYDHYHKLGFGKKPHLPLPAVAKGFVNHPLQWSKQSLISLSYGYEITSSLLQIAQAFCLIANDGFFVKPQIIMNNHKLPTKKKYKTSSILALKEILQKTTDRGTAYRARIKGYEIMTKTGSAHLLVNNQYSVEHNIYSCAGIIKKNDYQRVIALYMIKEGKGQEKLFASTIAVPAFQAIAEKTLLLDKAL